MSMMTTTTRSIGGSDSSSRGGAAAGMTTLFPFLLFGTILIARNFFASGFTVGIMSPSLTIKTAAAVGHCYWGSSSGLMGRERASTLVKNNMMDERMNIIDFQSNTDLYGRGEMHLSAILNEGDVVVYQTGSWYVDGVLVGDDNSSNEDDDETAAGVPRYEYALVDTIQVVWTHNCEHGLIRGLALRLVAPEEQQRLELVRDSPSLDSTTNDCNDDDDWEPVAVEFGPEQLIARIPIRKMGDSMVPMVALSDRLWRSNSADHYS